MRESYANHKDEPHLLEGIATDMEFRFTRLQIKRHLKMLGLAFGGRKKKNEPARVCPAKTNIFQIQVQKPSELYSTRSAPPQDAGPGGRWWQEAQPSYSLLPTPIRKTTSQRHLEKLGMAIGKPIEQTSCTVAQRLWLLPCDGSSHRGAAMLHCISIQTLNPASSWRTASAEAQHSATPMLSTANAVGRQQQQRQQQQRRQRLGLGCCGLRGGRL